MVAGQPLLPLLPPLTGLRVRRAVPSAGIVEPISACYKRRLTLRCSGRQPGVRPVAAAELKYR